jgi:bacteriocin biosynthesis cyclodehydratase domain-containing protein
MHPMLLPGTHLLRRGDGADQAGLRPDTAVVLPVTTRRHDSHDRHDRPDRRDVLTADGAETARLLSSGAALPDDRVVRRALPPLADAAAERWPRHAVAALARRCPQAFDAAVVGRERHRVSVGSFGHPVAALLADDTVALCRRSGLRVGLTGPRAGRPDPGDRLVLLVGVGEPHRELLDPLLHEGTSHLLVRLAEGEAVIGPLVVPGRTACLRCLDAYRTEHDPSWPLLVEQYARAVRTDRADGVPEPVDAALAALALAWAARDLATYAEGGTPTTLASTIELGPRLETIETRRWSPHPRCGCSWG